MKLGKILAVVGVSAAIFGLGSAERAEAATSTQTLSVSTALTDWSQNLNFNKFDSSLGTLNSVSFTFSSSVTTTITVTNTGTSSSNGTVRTEIRISLVDPSGYFAGDAPQIDAFVPLSDAPYTLAAGANQQLGPFSRNVSSGGYNYTTTQVLAEFTGTGTIPLTLSTFTQTLLANNGGNTSASQVTSANGNVTLVYDYTAVPEPTTALLVGAGGVALLLRRRRSQA